MRSVSRRTFLAGLALTPVLLSGCLSSRPLYLATHGWIGYESLFLARQHGWLASNATQLVETPSATDSLHLLGNGVVQAATLTLDEVLRARALGLDLRIPLIFDISTGADGVLSRQPMPLSALKGKRIGVEQSAVGALMLAEVLRKAELTAHDVTPIPLGFDEHLRAWRQHQVDVLITFEPTLTQLEKEGAVLLFDSRQMPDTIIDVLAVNASAIDSQQQHLRHSVAAILQAIDDMKQNRQDALYHMAARLHKPAAVLEQSLQGLQLTGLHQNHRMLAGAMPLLERRAKKVAAVLASAGLLSELSPALWQHLASAEFLPST